jgi:chromosome segregation ATPase
MSLELAYQSRQTEKLLQKNSVLTDENGDLRRQLSLSKQTEEELAKRNNVYQKTIKSLLTKLKEQGAAQEESGGIVAELESELGDLESALHLSQLQTEDTEHRLSQANTRLADRTSQLDAWGGQHDQAMRFLMTCLEDVRDKVRVRMVNA